MSVSTAYLAGDAMDPAYSSSGLGHVFGSALALMSKHLLLSSPRNSTVPAHAPRIMNQTKKMNTFMMYCAELNRVLTKRAPDLNLDSVRSGLTARMARRELSPSAPPLTKSRQTNEIITTMPSRMFHPLRRYASSPNKRPSATILTNISNMKRKVKKTSVPSLSAAFLVSSSGSYKAAMRRQLTMMLTKMRLLKFLLFMIAMASLRGDRSRSNTIRLSGFLVMLLWGGGFGSARVAGPVAGRARSVVHNNFRVGGGFSLGSPVERAPRRRLLLLLPLRLRRRHSGRGIILPLQRRSWRRQLLRAHLRTLALKPTSTSGTPPIAAPAADALSLVMVRLPPVAPTAPVAFGAFGTQRPRTTGHRHDAR